MPFSGYLPGKNMVAERDWRIVPAVSSHIVAGHKGQKGGGTGGKGSKERRKHAL